MGNHPKAAGFFSAVKFPGRADFNGLGGADQLRQPHGGIGRKKADLNLGLAELSALAGYNNITGNGQFHTAAQTETLHDRNDRHLELFGELKNAVESCDHIIHLFGLVIRHFHSGAKVFSFSVNGDTF